jgi:methanogenic corrinoid protein MtbC1
MLCVPDWLLMAFEPAQESEPMRPRPSRRSIPSECQTASIPMTGLGSGSAWPTANAEREDAKVRLAKLARTLEADVIPRLVGAHRDPTVEMPHVEAREIEHFVGLLRDGSDLDLSAAVERWRQHGLAVDAIFLELFSPAARHLGDLWVADRCDFSTVTICLGRLQRLLREWSPAFGAEVDHPPNGRRVLLAQHPDEQHSFGLSMVAEFFLREGWEVLGGVGGAVPDPSAQVARDWFDAVGFSVGGETRTEWLRGRVAHVRAASRNRDIVILVGGPLAVLDTGIATAVGADGSGHEGGRAPQLAEELLTARFVRR